MGVKWISEDRKTLTDWSAYRKTESVGAEGRLVSRPSDKYKGKGE